MELALVYMVAGISSRFGGRIKAFADVGDKKLIEHSLEQALPAGFSRIVFIVSHKTEKAFRDFFHSEYKNVPVQYALQEYNEEERDRPWGTTDALCSVRINCPLVVCNGDDIYGREDFKTLVEHLRTRDGEATIGYRLRDVIPETGKTNRGIFSVEDGYVTRIVETFDIEKNSYKSLDDLCSMNIFALHPETIDLLRNELTRFKKEHKGDRRAECLLPAEVSKLISSGRINMRIYPAKGRWYGVTNPGDEEIIRQSL